MGLALSVPSVQALSCAEPDIIQYLNFAQANEKPCYIFIDVFALPVNDMPSVEHPKRPGHAVNINAPLSGTIEESLINTSRIP